jgi:hypothetical protein
MRDTEPQYRCNDCGVDVLGIGEWYMAKPELWERQLGLGWSDNLCIGCLEQRLGRRVSLRDIGPASHWGAPAAWRSTSTRLLDRFGRKRKAKRAGAK